MTSGAVSGGSVHVGDANHDGYAVSSFRGWNGDFYADLYLNQKNGTFLPFGALSTLYCFTGSRDGLC